MFVCGLSNMWCSKTGTMKIRTITMFVNVEGEDLNGEGEGLDDKLAFALEAAAVIQSALEAQFYEIQTVRVSTNPFEEWLALEGDEFTEQVELVERLVAARNIQFFNFGPATSPDGLPCVVPILKASGRFSTSVSIPSSDSRLPDYGFCRACAEVVRRLGEETEGGLGNFRFCGCSQVQPFTPFYPASYSHGTPSSFSFSVGSECGDLLFLAFHGVSDLEEARRRLDTTLSQVYVGLHGILEGLHFDAPGQHPEWSMTYEGVDVSMNPSLDAGESVAFGFEWLRFGEHFGDWGSLV